MSIHTYVMAERLSVTEVMCEMKITLQKSKPFSCSPRRLSYI